MARSVTLLQPIPPLVPVATAEQWSWWGGVILTLVSINIALGSFTSRLSAEKHPRVIAAIISLSLTVLAVFLTQIIISSWLLDLVTLVIGVSLTLIVLFLLSKRDKKAVSIAEATVKSLHTVDIQINYILGEIEAKNDRQAIRRACRRAAEYSMAEIVKALSLSYPLEMRTSLLIARNGRFEVLGDHGISAHHIPLIERKLSYGSRVSGIAGLAANRRKPVCINNLSDPENKDAGYWTQIETERRDGSIVCYPIIKSRSLEKEERDQELIAVFCISCGREDSFSCNPVPQILKYYAAKLEALVNCYAINELYSPAD